MMRILSIGAQRAIAVALDTMVKTVVADIAHLRQLRRQQSVVLEKTRELQHWQEVRREFANACVRLSSDELDVHRCPFCKQAGAGVVSTQSYWVQCGKCGAEGPSAPTEEKAIELWNGACTK